VLLLLAKETSELSRSTRTLSLGGLSSLLFFSLSLSLSLVNAFLLLELMYYLMKMMIASSSTSTDSHTLLMVVLAKTTLREDFYELSSFKNDESFASRALFSLYRANDDKLLECLVDG
jgi:hypothetical protein